MNSELTIHRLKTPIPARMQKLDRDPRGYPIPFGVFRDLDGKPHFTINDTRTVRLCRLKDVCAICGQKLLRGRWFVGGPGSAFHPNGAFVDAPLHKECAEFALQVCPYLAAPRYGGRIDAATIDPARTGGQIFIDPTIDPSRPGCFVAIMTAGATYDGEYFRPKRPYIAVQFWRHGARIEAPPELREAAAKCWRGSAGQDQ